MTHIKSIALAGAIAVSGAFAASDADAMPFALSGDFEITAYNYNPSGSSSSLRSDNSQATEANFLDISGSPTSIGSVNGFDTFAYTGALDFNTASGDPNNDGRTTIAEFLGTGTGTVSGLDTTVGDLTNSAGGGGGDDGAPSGNFRIATLYKITATSLNIGDLSLLDFVNHDDGVTFLGSSGTSVASVGPNSERLTDLAGLAGGVNDFTLFYASANGDPSVLEVNAIPLPAAAWLLLGVTGGLVAAKRRQARRAA
mgnify:CR=1 FL=1